MTLSAHIVKRLGDLLEERRVVVWYDGERAFGDVAAKFVIPGCLVISAAQSRLRARREADEALRPLNDPTHVSRRNGTMLIYVPGARGTTEEEKRQDPFEMFALIGAAFGDKEADQLQSLARQAMPSRVGEIDRLFAEGRPTLALIEGLGEGMRYPLLAEALGTESSVEAAAQLLCREGARSNLWTVHGAPTEFLRLGRAELGFEVPPDRAEADAVAEQLARYVLLSEFAFEVAEALPDGLATVSRAGEAHRQRIFTLCDRMRGSDDTREAYLTLASRVETELRIRDIASDMLAVGGRETFPSQERACLSRIQSLAAQGDFLAVRRLLDQGRRSVWRNLPERAVLWKLAERCVDFLDVAVAATTRVPTGEATVRQWVDTYAADDGIWRLDRHQRLVEQGAAECNENAEVAVIVDLCRQRYRAVVGAAMTRFQHAVGREGWPPDGVARQTQTFDRYVAPVLAERKRIAYFLVDAMRYEMGRDLAQALDAIGSVEIKCVATVLPATTPCGMAALLPGADGSFALVDDGDDLSPAVSSRMLRASADRMNLLREQWGDRFRELPLSDLLSWAPKKLAAVIGSADLVVVRSQEIDALGEGPSLYHARKYMTGILGELRAATERLAAIGVTMFVYAADHGHVLLPEVAAGDVVTAPAGTWRKAKRRCRLGSSISGAPGVLVLPAAKVGIVTSVPEIAFATGLRLFTADPYFHEGLSLQECLVPVVTLQCRHSAETTAGVSVEVRYRSDQFTSRVIGLRIWYSALLGEALTIRLEAHDGSGPKARRVGEAADCDARDPITRLVKLAKGQETQVPLRVSEDFAGASLEVRAVDPTTGAVLSRLKLKNAMME